MIRIPGVVPWWHSRGARESFGRVGQPGKWNTAAETGESVGVCPGFLQLCRCCHLNGEKSIMLRTLDIFSMIVDCGRGRV